MLSSEALIKLIFSLSKTEKRNFKLMSNKIGDKNKFYVKLFDYLIHYKMWVPDHIVQHIPGIKRSQLSNLKANLSKAILRSLRDINKEHYQEIKAREKFDFAKVLYAKGQYRESIKMLQSVKQIAASIHLRPLFYLALNFEKQIESQHVTKSMSIRAYQLAKDSAEMIHSMELTNTLSNLSLLLYARYLEKGYVKNEKEFIELKTYFHSLLPSFRIEEMDFYQKLNLFQSYVWFYYMAQDFLNYYKYAQRWVNLYDAYPSMKGPATVIYLKGLHNVLNALFIAGKQRQFEYAFQKLYNFNSDQSLRLSNNEKGQLQLFKYFHGVNRIFLTINYKEGIELVEELSSVIREKTYPWDATRIMTFHYKIACVYFGVGRYNDAITYLNLVEMANQPGLKIDIQCFSRVLNLIAHYEQGNELLVMYKIKSVFRFLLKMGELEKVHRAILGFIRKTPLMKQRSVKSEFMKLQKTLSKIEKERFERRPFLYLDIISWLDSKIHNTSMIHAIKKRRVE